MQSINYLDISQISFTCTHISEALHTFIIERQHVELESTGLHANITVNLLCSHLMDGDGVLQGLHTRLQAERLLGVTHWVPGGRRENRNDVSRLTEHETHSLWQSHQEDVLHSHICQLLSSNTGAVWGVGVLLKGISTVHITKTVSIIDSYFIFILCFLRPKNAMIVSIYHRISISS